MNMQNGLLLGSLIAFGAANAPIAMADVIEVEIAPPAARIEVVPPPRAGYVWAPGYWSWEGGRHFWREGHWIEERQGYYWVPDRWASDGRRYYLEHGRWARGERREHERERERRRDD
jgi:hypothetical protein